MSTNETCGPTLRRAAQTFAGRFTGSQVFCQMLFTPFLCAVVDGAAVVIWLLDFYAEILHSSVSRLKSQAGAVPHFVIPICLIER